LLPKTPKPHYNIKLMQKLMQTGSRLIVQRQ